MAPVVKSHMPPAATAYMQGKLTAQPRELGTVSASPQKTSPFGLQPLGVHQSRDGLLYVPKSYAEPNKRPAPLFVMMHGAGGNAKGGMSYMLEVAEEVSTQAEEHIGNLLGHLPLKASYRHAIRLPHNLPHDMLMISTVLKARIAAPHCLAVECP